MKCTVFVATAKAGHMADGGIIKVLFQLLDNVGLCSGAKACSAIAHVHFLPLIFRFQKVVKCDCSVSIGSSHKEFIGEPFQFTRIGRAILDSQLPVPVEQVVGQSPFAGEFTEVFGHSLASIWARARVYD